MTTTCRTFLTRIGWAALGLAGVGLMAGTISYISHRTESNLAELIEIDRMADLETTGFYHHKDPESAT